MRFQVDIAGLVPGSTIDQATCEAAIGYTRAAKPVEFQFALMQLADHIGKLLWRAGCRWTVRTSDGEVHVLTHEQASKFNAARFNGGLDLIRRCHRRLAAVDIAELNPDLRLQHDESLARQARILQGIKGTRAVLEVSPVRRTVPLGGKRVVVAGT